MKKPKRISREQPRTDYSWLLIFASVFIAYIPALNGGLLWDDLSHITYAELRSIGGLWRIWTEIGATQQYYPLLHSAFWLEHRLWGDSMLGYHLANIALHSTAAVLVVLVLRQLAIPGALLAGLIFALHPVCVESVAWISEQKNTLSAVFYLTSALVYLRFVDRGGSMEQDPPYVRRYWQAFALFICALLTKTVTATLPAALLLVFWWQRGRVEWRDVRPLVPWFVVAAGAGALTAWFEHQVIGAQGEAFGLTLVERILLAGRVIFFYLGKLVWPANLIFVYPRWTIDATIWSQYLYPAAAIALAIALAWLARPSFSGKSNHRDHRGHRDSKMFFSVLSVFSVVKDNSSVGRRGPLAGYLFFCGTLVPVLGFVNVYPFVFSYVADHFQYLATLGIIVPVAAGLAIAPQYLDSWKGHILKYATAILVVTLGVVTWNRSASYANAETLFRDTIARNPHAWMAYQNLGTELAAQNRLAEAIEAFEGALRARSGYVGAKNNLVLARMRLGDSLADQPGRSHTAIANYEAVVRLDPDHFRAHYNLGTLLMEVPGRRADAIAHLERAVKLEPKSVDAQVNLGIALAEIPSRSGEAIAHLEAAVAAKPDLPVRALLERLHGDAGASRSEGTR